MAEGSPAAQKPSAGRTAQLGRVPATRLDVPSAHRTGNVRGQPGPEIGHGLKERIAKNPALFGTAMSWADVVPTSALKRVLPETQWRGAWVENQDPVGPVNIPYQSNYRIVRWIGGIHDAHPSFGPAIFTAAALYFVVQIIAAWVFIPSYSLVSNSISDLGETSCGGYGSPGM